MTYYLRQQDQIEIEIDEYGDMSITQVHSYNGDESTIFITLGNIEWFVELIEMANQEGHKQKDTKGESDGLVQA